MEFTDEIVKQFEAMIAGIAWFYTADPTTHKDLMQEAYEGLRKACEQYRPERGSFSTYAHIKARAEIQQYLNYDHRLVHYPIAHEHKCNTVEMEGRDFRAACSFESMDDIDLLAVLDDHMSDIIREHFMEGVSVTKLAEQRRETRDSIRAKIEAGLNELREVVA